LLEAYRDRVKTGVPGVAYVRLDESLSWPEQLQVILPNG
jgi:HlyD family secretion protein